MWKVVHRFHTPVHSDDIAVPLKGGTVEVRTKEEALGLFRTQVTGKPRHPMLVSVVDPDGNVVIEANAE